MDAALDHPPRAAAPPAVRAAGTAARAPRGALRGHVPGEPGLWVLIMGDLTVFSFMFAAYLAQRVGHRALFAQSQGSLDRGLGALNTVVLLTSSAFVVAAVRCSRSWTLANPAEPSDVRRTRLLLLGAVGCATIFCGVKAVEWTARVSAGQTPSTNVFFTYYFVLTGVHLLHVIIGTGVLGVLGVRAGSSGDRRRLMEGGACFWHMVDLLWILLFAVVYLVH